MIQSWTGFQPLKEVWLGAPFGVSWCDAIFADSKDVEKLQFITRQTQHEMDHFQRIMENDGIVVRRPSLPSVQQIYDEFDEYEAFLYDSFPTWDKKFERGSYERFVHSLQQAFQQDAGRSFPCRPQMNPRDEWLVYGNTLFCFLPVSVAFAWWGDTLDEYIHAGYDIRFYNMPGYYKGVCPPSVVRLGKHVIYETATIGTDGPGQLNLSRAIEQQYGTTSIISDSPDGRHSDGQFAVLRPGTVLSSKNRADMYADTIPGWEVIICEPEFSRLPEQQQQDIEEMRFVNRQIKSWIGDATQSFFDVNCLVRDPEHVYVCNPPPKDLGCAYTVIPWKYRWFWDGGLHCITLDVHRTGEQENYFEGE